MAKGNRHSTCRHPKRAVCIAPPEVSYFSCLCSESFMQLRRRSKVASVFTFQCELGACLSQVM